MSHLKKILIELENCVHSNEQFSGGVPVVWSREVQKKLSQNADHWNNAQRKKSHVGDMDFQDDTQARRSYGNEEEEYSQEKGNNDCIYGDAYRDYMKQHGHEEQEENKTRIGLKTTGLRGDEHDDCPDCFGTGMDFPRLKGDCATCKGSRKRTEEEEEVLGKDKKRKLKKELETLRNKALRGYKGIKKEDFRRIKEIMGLLGQKIPKEEQEEEPRMARNRPQGERQQPRREDNPDEKDPENVAVDDQYDLDDPNDQEDFGDDEDELGAEEHWDDPDFQGALRTVPNTHLVYKRQQEDGTFHELWQYNLGDDFKKELTVRRAILAGTDIPINKMRSPDNSQSYELWTIGNGQMLQVKGLPN